MDDASLGHFRGGGVRRQQFFLIDGAFRLSPIMVGTILVVLSWILVALIVFFYFLALTKGQL
jgi:hypothetical protein